MSDPRPDSHYPREAFRRWVKDNGGCRKAAAKLGFDDGAVSRWMNGKRTPEPEVRARIEEIAGITAKGPWMVNAAKVKWPAPPEIKPGATAKDRASAHVKDLEARLAAVNAALAAGEDVPMRDRVALDAAYSRAIQVYGRLSGELELTEAQIVKSPAWSRIVEAVFRALEPFPQAAESVVKALDKLDGVNIEVDPADSEEEPN